MYRTSTSIDVVKIAENQNIHIFHNNNIVPRNTWILCMYIGFITRLMAGQIKLRLIYNFVIHIFLYFTNKDRFVAFVLLDNLDGQTFVIGRFERTSKIFCEWANLDGGMDEEGSHGGKDDVIVRKRDCF